ncbi:MAG TPA: T9SS type A sorting domain-containing protein, partial [Chryseolinea sp.]
EELVFPLQLGTANSDTWLSDGSSFPGTYDFTCIGSGTLKLPNGTYASTLLVRAEVVNGFLNIVSYFWYNADNGAVLLQYLPGDDFIIPESAVYLTSMSIGIEENEVPYKVYYNNPVDDLLSLTLVSNQNATMEYTVINSIGDVLDHSTFRTGSQQTSNLELDFSRYAAGIYFVRFGNESGVHENMKSIKIMKR